MEKYTMFMDWKNQYSENEYTTQSNLEGTRNLTKVVLDDIHKLYDDGSEDEDFE